MKVHVIGNEFEYEQMWRDNGHEIVVPDSADVVQFTGGADVCPVLYGEDTHPYTSYDAMRDEAEGGIFDYFLEQGVPMVGICRGAQFLNVMCGGKLWQHVDNHAVARGHTAVDLESGKLLHVTSTHHQMMRPAPDAKLLMVASEATVLENMEDGEVKRQSAERGTDVEAVWYPNERALCFQPHPEYMEKDSACQRLYFEYINRFIGE